MNQRITQLILLSFTTIFFTNAYCTTTLYAENFTGQNNKGAFESAAVITIDTTGANWSVDTSHVNLQNASDYIQVVNEKI